jgi:RNA polymerase sigma factor (TIGR02999 family)
METEEFAPTGDQGAGCHSSVAVGSQDRRALDQLFSATYEELRRLAQRVRRGESSHTLSPTALVNEAWMKLARSPQLRFESPLHFRRIAARAMRQLLVEAARRRLASKRGGDGSVQIVTFDESVHDLAVTENQLLALDAALDELALSAPRQAQMIECRFFGGMDVAATATLLEISAATLMRDWRAAKAWLAQALRSAR